MSRGFSRLPVFAQRFRDTFDLLLERRLWLVLGVDALLLSSGLFEALAEGADAERIYRQMVLIPLLLLAVPTMSAVIALERRSGSIDLALAVPSTERYFTSRVLRVKVFFLLQGSLVLCLGVEWDELPRGLAQGLVTCALCGAMVLFWAVRLRTAGAVMVATWLSLAALGRWVFADPFPVSGLPRQLLGVPRELWAWLWNLTVLSLATLVFFLYARQRLRRPERLL